ncbi:MAG: hypothetical protein ACRC0F_02000 [Cetobacterium sp.]
MIIGILSFIVAFISLYFSWYTIYTTRKTDRINMMPMLSIESSNNAKFCGENIINNCVFMIENNLEYIGAISVPFEFYDFRQKIRLVLKNISDNIAFDLCITELVIDSAAFKSILKNNESSYNLFKFNGFGIFNRKNKILCLKKDKECNLSFSINVRDFEKLDIKEKNSCHFDMKLKISYKDIYSNAYEQIFYLKDIELNTIGEYSKINKIHFELPPVLKNSKRIKIQIK